MRKLIAAVGLTLVAGGCVHSHGAPAAYSPPPLDAWFASPEPELRFRASRPAHAAVFEIVPGVGTTLLYPSGWTRPRADAGGPAARVFEDAVHRDRLPAALPDRNDWRSARSPRYLFLVASDYPLDLGPFGRDGYVSSGAAMDLGLSGQRPLETMERLVEITVPWTGDDNTWTSDFYVEWPRDPRTLRRSTDVLVACHGYEVFVPAEYEAQLRRELCAGAAAGWGSAAGDAPGPTERAGRPRPRPESPVTTGGEGYRPRSRQLEQPGSRGPGSRPAGSGRGGVDGGESGRPGAVPGSSPMPGEPGSPADRPGRARPATPADPNGPGRPATPATPATTNGPGRPATPATPAEPGGRGGAATPATPATPNGPGRPATPANPPEPGGPGRPATPATPAEPNGPGQPAAPAKPATPQGGAEAATPAASPTEAQLPAAGADQASPSGRRAAPAPRRAPAAAADSATARPEEKANADRPVR